SCSRWQACSSTGLDSGATAAVDTRRWRRRRATTIRGRSPARRAARRRTAAAMRSRRVRCRSCRSRSTPTESSCSRARSSTKPIAGATVLRPDEEDESVTTGADGKAVLHGLANDWVRITASAPGYGPKTESKGIGGGDKETTLEIALAKGAAVSGRVIDETGA